MAAQSLVLSGTSTPAIVAGSTPTGGAHGYIRVRLKPLSGTAYFGDSGVTTAGFPLSTADSMIDVNLSAGETLWFCSSSAGTPTVAVLRVGETT